MTNPFFANAAIISASSLLIQNSTRQLAKQAEHVAPIPLTKAQEYVAIGTSFGVLVVMLFLTFALIIRTTLDLFR